MRRRLALRASVLLIAAVLAWLWLREEKRSGPAEVRVSAPHAGDTDLAGETTPGAAPEIDAEPARELVATSNPAVEAASAERIMRLLVLREEDEQPLAGARVTAFEDDGERSVQETDAGGRCVLRVRPSAQAIRLLVESEGHFHVSAYFDRRAELTVRLASTVTLFGRVLAADSGAAVPGAKVALSHGWCKRCEPDVTIADDQGRYELAGVPRLRGSTFFLGAEGFATQYRAFEIRSDEPRVEVDFHLEHGVELTGRVVDFQSGVGISGAAISDGVGETATDSSGAFQERLLLDEGGLDLRITAKGYCQLTAHVQRAQLEGPLEFRLPRGAIVAGVVKDPSGQPIAGADVGLVEDHRARAAAGEEREPSRLDELPEGWRLEPEGYFQRAETDAAGRFRIENAVPWSTLLELRGSAGGREYATQTLVGVGGPGEVTWTELVLASTPSEVYVSGRIWLNGAPLSTGRGRVHWSGLEHAGQEELEDGGDFAVLVEPGDVAFRVEVDGLPSPLAGAEFTLRVEPGARNEHQVELRVPTKPIRGRLGFEDGAPAPGVAIDASMPPDLDGHWERLHFAARTDAEGRFAVEVPDVAALYRVSVKLDNDERSAEGVHAGASGVDLVLARAGALRFRFREAGTDALLAAEEFELGWKRSTEQEFRSMYLGWPLAPDPDGWYELRLPGGRVDLRATGRGGYQPTLIEGVRLDAHEPRAVEIVMTAGCVAELRLAPGQAPLPDDHVLFLIEAELWDLVRYFPERKCWEAGPLSDSLFDRQVRFDESGATVRGLGPGRYRFKVFPDDLVLEPAEVVVSEDVAAAVPIRWRER